MISFIFGLSLFIALADFFLANYIFYKDTGSGFQHLAAARASISGLFCLFSAFFYLSASNESASVWNQVRAVPLIILPAITFHFTWRWTKNKTHVRTRIFPILVYISALFFIAGNFFTDLLGIPVRYPLISWVTITVTGTIWPLLFIAWAIILVVFSALCASLFFSGIKNNVERKQQMLVFLGLAVIPFLAVLMGLLPAAGWPDLLVYLPFWLFISDLLIAIGLTSKNFFSVNFSNAYYPIIQSMKEAILLVDMNFTIQAVNSAFCRLMEKPEGGLVGQQVPQIFQQDQIPIRQIMDEINQQSNSNFSTDLMLENEKVVSAEITATPVFDKVGRVSAIAILIDDTSSIKAAEEKLKTCQSEIRQENDIRVSDLKKTIEMLEADLGQCKAEEIGWRKREFENEALAKLSSALRTSRSMEEMLSTLLTETSHILEVNSGAILLKQANDLVIISLSGISNEYHGFRLTPGNGILWKAFQSGQPAFLQECRSLPEGDLPPFLQEASSVVVYPLKTSERQLGLLVLGFNYKKPFDEFDQSLISAISNIASNALFRSHMIDSLEERVLSRNRELETLFKIASIANEAREPITLLDQTQKILLEALSSTLAVIYIHGKNDQVYISASQDHYPTEIQNELKGIALENSIWGSIFRSGQPLLVDSLDEDGRIDIKIVTELESIGNCAFIGTPIRGSTETLGAICVFRNAGQPFLQEDLALLGTAAHQLGVAIEIINLRKLERLSLSRIERQRLAGELYDSISQLTSSSFFYADASGKLLQKGDTWNAAANMEQIRQSSHQALKDVRLLMHQMQPGSIENLGLYGAIQHRLETVERRAHIEAVLTGEYGFKLPGNMEENLYRIVEEILNYSARFSQASKVNLNLKSDYDCILIEFSDNGNGKEPAEAEKKAIIANIRERVANLGGNFEMENRPGAGSVMSIKFSA